MRPLPFYASILIGAFFCLALQLTTAPGAKAETPDWTQGPINAGLARSPAESERTQSDSQPPRPASAAKFPTSIRFVSYNLKNYLTMRRHIHGEERKQVKPKEEIKALVQILKDAQPDILGICEIGSQADLKDLQQRLAKAGISLPHSHRVSGSDPTRALAILSRFPLVIKKGPRNTRYQLNSRPFTISRGILDVSLPTPSGTIRFLGCHLKSKRPSELADQELIRRNESILLRRHISEILKTQPDTRLIVYGDLNDTKRSQSLNTIKGRLHAPDSLSSLQLVDSRGHGWTHHWAREDVYSRFDYVLVNRAAAAWVDLDHSGLLDPPTWREASDHRPLLVIIRRPD